VQRALGAKQNKEALAAARSLGLSAAAAKLGAEELLTLASEARAQQASREASVLLRGLRDRFPGTDQSAMASFDLGRIAEDIDGKPVQAAVHFEQYIKEQPQGPLLREALGRAMESQERAGNLDAARAHATQYLERFPQGPHAKTARKLTAPPGVLK
jgi:TolA-binding protein